ncbi:MAG: class I SAM-dependent methyltransferase [Methanobrevibacter arboriphilus]|uniref:Class I SAM-dependent methyltransferase n=1 Tax=Methanobrevibacter arboriphilus TaxID=39441 RepID=A0A843AIC4_METAZ|nr:class I SAM-dependent methyltransferase [Methanobrevibacter arboriphilus]MBF4468906.1 class I SAM-dependent methyltransferase [Methanobrevibacter arboriphilus]
MKKQKCISDPEDIDWEFFWQEKLHKKRRKPKNWDNEADKFSKRSKQDEYQKKLFSKMRIDKDDTVIDLGCGEGSITIPLSKKVKSITAVDSSKRMLEILDDKCKAENIDNIKTMKENLEDVTLKEVGNKDIVLLSRSINGISPIKDTINNVNSIANKYVYITIFGPKNWKFENDFYESIGKEKNDFAPYDYLFNILISMNIYPNIENLEIETNRKYKSVQDAMDNGKWQLDTFTKEEKENLYKYLEKNLRKNNEGMLENPNDKADWILIWWKK